uniref:Uncharacterized protein n=1 Tax=Solanum tuberosum TaxID=4113 RepID=M1B511_SOLTU
MKVIFIGSDPKRRQQQRPQKAENEWQKWVKRPPKISVLSCIIIGPKTHLFVILFC